MKKRRKYLKDSVKLKDMEKVSWVEGIIAEKRGEHQGIDEKLLAQEVVREVMGSYILDVQAESMRRIAALNPACADDVRYADGMIVGMSGSMEEKDKALREFLKEHLYRHPHLNRARLKTSRIVQDLFETFIANHQCLPPEWLKQVENVPEGWEPEVWRARSITDYIASMTDRFAILEHGDIFNAYQGIR